MLLDSDSEPEEVEEDYDDLLSTLGLAYHAISDSRYLNRGTRGSAGRLPIEDAIAEYLSYPDRSFLVDFRMHRELRYVLHHSTILLSDGERNVTCFLTNQKPFQGT